MNDQTPMIGVARRHSGANGLSTGVGSGGKGNRPLGELGCIGGTAPQTYNSSIAGGFGVTAQGYEAEDYNFNTPVAP